MIACLGALAGGVHAQPSAAAARTGTFAVDFRYRFESVAEDARPRDGQASTLRTTLTYRSAPLHGLRLFLQAENVVDVGFADSHRNAGFGDRGNDVRGRPVIADPPGTDFLQWNVEYRGDDTTVRLGRQILLYDDQRFVGAVGWRQHHQSFRALHVRNESIPNLTAQYAYVDRVYRIFGDGRDADTHLLNARYVIDGFGSVTGYAYLVAFEDAALSSVSTDTFGAELRGAHRLGDDLVLRYELELAHQRDARNNPERVRAGYVNVSIGMAGRGFAGSIGWERLGGEPGDGRFQTPLATLHGFNGWADKFLATPPDGLEDLSLRLSGPAGPTRWSVRYHRFGAASTDVDYGTELDLQWTWTAPWDQTFGLKAALYRADAFSTDTTKLWLFSTYRL